MRKGFQYISLLLLVLFVVIIAAACGGSSGGGLSAEDATTIEGTLSSASANARVLSAGDSGIAGVTVSALGDSQETDRYGNFSLTVDGTQFTGGGVLFTLTGGGIEGSVAFDDVAGGRGVTAYVDLVVESDGSISGASSDASGNTLSTVGGPGDFGCTEMKTFSDGGGNNLWKPESESTGTVVILMPGSYRNADFSIVDTGGNSVASVLKRHCCEHNGGRDHVYLTRSADSLAGESLPLTVMYDFGADNVHCLPVSDPRQRWD